MKDSEIGPYKYRCQRTQETLDLYKTSRQTFKAHCNSKKSVYNNYILGDLVSRLSNLKSFWNKLKNLTGTRKSLNNITKEQWKSHFELLFASGEAEEGADNVDVGDNDFEYDITENKLDDIIFNAAITDEEIIKAVKSLKRGKSSSQDELIPNFFIYSIELILPLLIKLFNRILDTGDFPSS